MGKKILLNSKFNLNLNFYSAPTNKICLVNYDSIFDLANEVFAKKVDGEVVYESADQIRKSFQNYFRHRVKKNLKNWK